MEIPSYIKNTTILLGLVLLLFLLYVGRSIFIPVSLGFLIAVQLFRPFNLLLRIKVPHSLAALICIATLFIVLGLLFTFIGQTVGSISQELPAIGSKVNALLERLQSYVQSQFGLKQQDQLKYVKQWISSLSSGGSGLFSTTVTATAGFVTFMFLFVLSIFFLLYYRNFFKTFVLKIFTNKESQAVKVMTAVKTVIQNYLSGLLLVMLIVGILNTIGLWILGINHAIFFGMLAGFLMIIPFIGILIGSLLPIIYAFVTEDSLLYPLGVAGVFWFVQVLEANVITPNIIGSKVSINAYATILAVFIGGELWGGAGMILFIPLIAILKVIFDSIPSLEPIGYLIGEPFEENKKGGISTTLEKIRKKIKRN